MKKIICLLIAIFSLSFITSAQSSNQFLGTGGSTAISIKATKYQIRKGDRVLAQVDSSGTLQLFADPLTVINAMFEGAGAKVKENSEKKYAIVLTDQEVSVLLFVLDKSNAEHLTVTAVKDLLIKQLQAQVEEATRDKKQ
jgi:hypothetical protein